MNTTTCLPAVRALLLAAALATGLRAARADEPPAPAPAPTPAPSPGPGPDAPRARMFDPRFREGKPTDMFGTADAPLSRATVDAYVDFVEAWHDITITAPDEQALRDSLETAWAKLSDDDHRWFERQCAARDRIRPAAGAPFDAATAKGYLDTFGVELNARVAAEPERPWHAAIRRSLERKGTSFSMTPAPSVSIAALDAFEEMVIFLVSVARNDATAPTEGQRIAVRPASHRAMEKSGAAVRRHYARMPRFWALVKARWDQFDDAARLRFRWSVLRLFRRIARLPLPQGEFVLDLPGYAKMAAEVAAAVNTPDAYTSAFANLGETITVVVEGLGMDTKDLEPAFTQDRLTMR